MKSVFGNKTRMIYSKNVSRAMAPWRMQARLKSSQTEVSGPMDVIQRKGFYNRLRGGDGTSRGQVLIIGNGKYETCSPLDPSTHMDADLYEESWKNIGLNVTKEYDLTGKQIWEVIKETQSKIESENDMFVLCYSGHGARMNINPGKALRSGSKRWGGKKEVDDCIIGVDGSPVSIFHLTHKFNNKKFPLLRHKPKIFMFDCCRGALIERSMTKKDELRDIHIPLAADMILARATMDYHVSYSPSLSQPGVYTKAFHTAMTDPNRNTGSFIDVLFDVASQMKDQGCYESANFTAYLTKHIDVLPSGVTADFEIEEVEKIHDEHPNSYWPAFLKERMLKYTKDV